MAEFATIARPYAQAVFELAQETDTLDQWSSMLALLSALVQEPVVKDLLQSHRLEKAKLAELVFKIGEGHLSQDSENLVKILVDQHKFILASEISRQYEILKAAAQGYVSVEVISTYALKSQQKQQVSDALKARLGKDVKIETTIDRKLLGGWLIRIGDQVLDLSVRGRLAQMGAELRR
jgi:F-type H+-transporting ATPase subunit delta